MNIPMTPEEIEHLATQRTKAKLGWGVGLALHGISVFALGAGGDLRERMIRKERERLQRRRQNQF